MGNSNKSMVDLQIFPWEKHGKTMGEYSRGIVHSNLPEMPPVRSALTGSSSCSLNLALGRFHLPTPPDIVSIRAYSHV